jgi:hypothetical protein
VKTSLCVIKHRLEDTIKMDVNEVGCVGVEGISQSLLRSFNAVQIFSENKMSPLSADLLTSMIVACHVSLVSFVFSSG